MKEVLKTEVLKGLLRTEVLKEVQMHFLEHEQAQHSPVELCIYAALGDHVQTDKRLPCTKKSISPSQTQSQATYHSGLD